MMRRRDSLMRLAFWPWGLASAPASWSAVCSTTPGNPFLPSCTQWPRGIEGQRKADLGNGTYINPILSGDRPDPTVLKDGDDYYMTHSSFEACPGLLIWHSKDLVNWRPLGHALHQYIGSVWAPELCKHQGRFFLYIPAKKTLASAYPDDIWVMHADHIQGPWSEPVRLGNRRIDPGHAVGEDGRRYLFLSGGFRVPLSDDGLQITGPEQHVYQGWRYPEHWITESYSQEGPKILKHGEWFHMVLAVGGTAGPPTSHMVICARSRSINGPWENHPNNPILRTKSPAEHWWSKGHGTLILGPDQQNWYMVYHGYEAGFHTLGRQTLMMPMRLTPEGWFEPVHIDESRPLPTPQAGQPGHHGMALSDNFSGPKLGPQWAFFRGGTRELSRIRLKRNTLHLKAKGLSPADSAPLCMVTGDQAYEMEVDVAFDPSVQAGLLLFYSDRLYAGIGVNDKSLILHRYGLDQRHIPKPDGMANQLRIRLVHAWHVLTIYTSHDRGRYWQKFPVQMDVSGYHHNVAYGFMSLRPALYATGTGEARFQRLTYRAIP